MQQGQVVVDGAGHFLIHGRLQPKVVVAGFTSKQKATRKHQLVLKYKGLPEDEAKAAVDRDLAAWIEVHEKGGKLTKHGARFPEEERAKKRAKKKQLSALIRLV